MLTANEAVLQAVAEISLLNDRIPELCMVMNKNKEKGDDKFEFADLFLGDLNCAIVELKYINIAGLIRAMKNDWNILPNTKDLTNLNEYIEYEDEVELLKRQYMFWSEEDNRPKLTTIGKILLK